MSIFVKFAIPIVVLTFAALAQPYPDRIGIGVAPDQWGRLFADVSKMARPFVEIGTEDEAPMDSMGYPLSDCDLILMETWPVAEWVSDIDDPEQYKLDLSGTYHCSFVGQADVSRVWGDFTISPVNYDSATNTSTFDIEIAPPSLWDGNGFVNIRFENTRRTPSDTLNSGFTHFKAMLPGYSPDTNRLFNDDYIECLQTAGFSTIRSMNLSMTNGNNPEYPDWTEWSDRRQIGDATYKNNPAISEEFGTPWEVIIALANSANKDLWVSVPVAATDEYIYELAHLLDDSLETWLKIYVEWSNEVWNWGFLQSQWNNEWAESLGLNYIEGYAKRTAEISLIFRDVFGEEALNRRIRVVNCWQVGWWPPDWQYREQMEYIEAHFAAPESLIWGLGVAPYMNCGSMCGSGSPTEIVNEMWNVSDDSDTSRKLVAAVAEEFNLKGGMLAYEGGTDTGGGSTVNVGNRILAERDSLVWPLMVHDLADNWFPSGGGLFVYLDLVGPYSRYGCWGLTDDVTEPYRNYKFYAVRELLGDDGTIPDPPESLSATENSGMVFLDWNSARGSYHYVVRRGTSPGGPYSEIAYPASPGYIDYSAPGGMVCYAVAAHNPIGTGADCEEVCITVTSVEDDAAPTPADYAISAHPNPFNSAVRINVKFSPCQGEMSEGQRGLISKYSM